MTDIADKLELIRGASDLLTATHKSEITVALLRSEFSLPDRGVASIGDRDAVVRVAKLLQQKIDADQTLSNADLRRSLSARDREHFPAAMALIDLSGDAR